jgi:hypothetical protein
MTCRDPLQRVSLERKCSDLLEVTGVTITSAWGSALGIRRLSTAYPCCTMVALARQFLPLRQHGSLRVPEQIRTRGLIWLS